MKRAFMMAAALGLVLGVGGQAKAGLITNGSFEMGIDPGNFTTLSAGDSTSITGWAVGGNGVDYIGTYWMASDGSRSIDLSALSAGSISQNLNTTNGATYTILFDLSGNPDGGAGPRHLEVSAGSNQTYVYTVTGANTHTNMHYVTDSFTFTAAGATTNLSFISLENNAFGPVLDNIRDTPEPASMTLLCLGIAGMAGYGWRSRKQQKA